MVAFVGDLVAGGRAIATGKDGISTILYDETGKFSSFAGHAWINDRGVVVFLAGLDSGQFGIFKGKGRRARAIVIAGSHNLTAFPSMNRHGVVSFVAADVNGVNGIFVGNGRSGVTTLVDTSGPYSSFGAVSAINNNGVVVFFGLLDIGGSALATAGTDSRTIADTTSGAFSNLGSASINNKGQVVFYGELPTGENGIFAGPSPMTDKVIMSGDPLLGSTVVIVSLSWKALNDSGQIAFSVFLADGTLAVVRADPRDTARAHP